MNGSVALATLYAAKREKLPSDFVFGQWLLINSLGKRYNNDDRAALINMGRNPQVMRKVLGETYRRSYQHIWREYQDRFRHVTKQTSEPTFLPETTVKPPMEAPKPEPAAVQLPAPAPKIVVPAKPVRYDVPTKSKLGDLIGDKYADVLHSRFKHSRIFVIVATNNGRHGRTVLRHLAKRCQQPNYPAELYVASTWSLQLVYPLLPKKLVDMMPANLSTLNGGSMHSRLIETEEEFAKTPEFGMTDPPLAAFNKAYAIYTAIANGRREVDPAHLHRPTFDNDEGKPPVIICGTQVWPAATGSGYTHADLRCAIGVTDDILKTFLEPADLSASSKSLKLRHVLSWLPGGYNAVGSTLEGTMRALTAVVQAYSAAKSEEMRFRSRRSPKRTGTSDDR